MAKDGINWGKVILGAAGITAAALVAPSVLNGIADATIGEGVASAAAGAPLLDQAGEMARTAATSLSSTYAGAATSLGVAGATDFSSLSGVYDALSKSGSQAIEWVGNNKTQSALIGGAAALGGAAVGQWTSKAASGSAKPAGPGGMSYADYIRARQRLAAMTPPTRMA